MRIVGVFQICLAAILLGEGKSEELTNALAVRSLTSEEAESGIAVDLQGTVIFSDSPSTVFIQDETAGTFFRLGGAPSPKPGDLLRVRGLTFPGLYLTGVERAKFEVLDHIGLPAPQVATFEDLRSGRYHYQRVKIEGVVRTVSLDDEGTSSVRVAMGSSVVEVRIDALPDPKQDFVDCKVGVSGLAAGHINDRRQLVHPYLRCHDWSEIVVMKRPSKIPLVSAEQVLNFDVHGQEGHRVRFRGQVLASFPGGDVFLRGETSSIRVRLASVEQALQTGEVLEVLGFPEMSEFSASLTDAKVLKVEKVPEQPLPVETNLEELASGELDGDLIALTAILADWYRTKDGVELVVQDSPRSVRVLVPETESGFVAGSKVRVQGICSVTSALGTAYSTRPEAMLIRCRSGNDVRMIGAPSWWTPRRLATILAVVCVATLAAGLWITLLRRQVQQQTSALRQKIESEAALEERQRIAREFHDTLEQDLAGLSLRLDAAVAKEGDNKVRGFLKGARSLVSRIQSETRNLVSDLRSDGENGDQLEQALQELVEEHNIDLEPSVKLEIGELPHLPPRIVHHLKMITREAVTNVIKHAKAKSVTIWVSSDEPGNGLKLEIRDDGKGFDVESETKGKSGHFGCMGIRERCRKVGASAEWESRMGEGSVARIRLPLQTGEVGDE
tara:strand:+ start:5830 stop:7845 length:2016 start_codon:yes stop_codon:yes gene_type:complete